MKFEVRGWTALRGIASIWVVLYHFARHFSTPLQGPWITNGYWGVDVFFTLSGAVLYYVYAQSFASGGFSYRDFLWKRFARLYPVHFISLLIALAITIGGPIAGLGAPPKYDALWATLVSLSLLQGWNLTPGLTLNYPSWSISTEFFAYLLFPITAWLAIRLPPRLSVWYGAAGMVIYIILLRRLMGDDRGDVFEWTTYFSVLRIVPEFFFGLTLARFVLADGLSASRPQQSWTVLLVALATMLVAISQSFPIIFVLASGALIAALMVVPMPVPRSLHYLGIISYSVYMTHGLVEKIGFRILEIAGGWPDDSVPLWTLGPMLVVVLLTGSLMYHLIEIPGRKLFLQGFAIKKIKI